MSYCSWQRSRPLTSGHNYQSSAGLPLIPKHRRHWIFNERAMIVWGMCPARYHVRLPSAAAQVRRLRRARRPRLQSRRRRLPRLMRHGLSAGLVFAGCMVSTVVHRRGKQNGNFGMAVGRRTPPQRRAISNGQSRLVTRQSRTHGRARTTDQRCGSRGPQRSSHIGAILIGFVLDMGWRISPRQRRHGALLP